MCVCRERAVASASPKLPRPPAVGTPSGGPALHSGGSSPLAPGALLKCQGAHQQCTLHENLR